MRQNVRNARVLGTLALAGIVMVGLSGCGRGGIKDEFAKAPEQRSLEIPPDLVAATAVPSTPSASASQSVRPVQRDAVQTAGFTLPGERDAVYGRVGTLLEGIDGLVISSRAQLLGSYDVSYQGSNFLVRVVAVEAGVYVSAVDPRGVPATGAASDAVLAALKAGLAG